MYRLSPEREVSTVPDSRLTDPVAKITSVRAKRSENEKREIEIAEGIFEIGKNSPGRVVIGGYRPLVDSSFVVGVLFIEHRTLLVDLETRQVQGVVQAVLQIMRLEEPVQTVPDTIGILVFLKFVAFPRRHTFLGLRDKQIARRPLCRRSDIIRD